MLDNICHICILFALPEEINPFVRQIGLLDLRPREGAAECWHGVLPHKPIPIDLTVAVSGVGQRNAAKSAELLLSEKTDVLLICGFAGGLAPNLPGDTILADKVTDETETFLPDAALFAAANSLSVPDIKIQMGTLITHDRVLVSAQNKRELAERTGAIAVDMETAGAVRVAEAQGIPWLAVRAITDTVNDDLPLDFNALANPDGSINRIRVVRATLAQPWKIPALIRLGINTSLAANNLAAFLVAFLQTLPENK